ncbi:hypothetical protein C7I36_11425 [Zobellella taiwanensis]|uniref:Nickel/cobalt transporter regulator n=1 Tax=Zobellella taiwanensis TaxID=347535 RepID=A0A2P7QQJ8_9GAMM|nr:anti-virulence regulator CigR family protein [Zobellella taiwanensis]PSJ40232.1 hypothetical protein C7I36_11425 [Zobellella taiwanensis]
MKTRITLAALMLGGLLGTAPALAQPPEGRGPGQAPGQQKDAQWRQDEHRDRDWDRERRHDNDRSYRREPDIDERLLRSLFREHREWIGVDRAGLPPGIAKNLRRGKPLPPGIAKNFDPRLRDRLPYYEGYEWRRVDNKAVLVELATQNVRYILEDILN